MPEWLFTEVSVAGAPPVQFCVDPAAGDPVADWFLAHDWIDEPVQRAFVGLIQPGMRVLDLGCHLGTFSLPAAVLGASVLAVDATSSHVELLNAAATRNGFEQLHCVHRAITDAAKPVQFVERSIHGHVRLPDEPDGDATVIEVAPATVDALLEERGWDDVDVIKMDIEGMETVALAGMKRLHARGSRPMMVFECNGAMLPQFGSSICELRERVVELGYELLLVDHLHPGTLVQMTAGAIQPECVCDYIAVAGRPKGLARQWRIDPPFSREQTLSRLLDTAAGEGGGYRAYAAAVLVDGPAWLREQPDARGVTRALEADAEPAVRAAFDRAGKRSAAVEHTLEPEPAAGGRPADMRVWARGISVRRRADGLDRPFDDGEPGPPELLLEDAWFHVRAGQLVGVLCEQPECSSALLRVLAGGEPPHAGTLERSGRAVLLAQVGQGLEGALTVTENVAVFGAFLGCAVAEAQRRSAHLAELAGLPDRLETRLDELDAEAVAGLALTVALELAAPELLLVDRMPGVPASRRDWLRGRVWALRQAGGAVVQVVSDASALLAPADRMLWIEDRSLVSNGHAGSVLEARWRRRLGMGSTMGAAA